MSARVAVIDYGMGNLYSVARACEVAELGVVVTSDPAEVDRADGVVLPGVGAFGDGMRELDARGLVEPLKRYARAGRPFFGICLGMQFLLGESLEFGRTAGLGLIAGAVVPLGEPRGDDGEVLKVPEVGWNTIVRPPTCSTWARTPLATLASPTPFYFVHSYVAVPTDPRVVAAVTRYGDVEFCSALSKDNLFGCQFHPERSGASGLELYRNFAAIVEATPRVPRGTPLRGGPMKGDVHE
jgi:glutamine amidotransferase